MVLQIRNTVWCVLSLKLYYQGTGRFLFLWHTSPGHPESILCRTRLSRHLCVSIFKFAFYPGTFIIYYTTQGSPGSTLCKPNKSRDFCVTKFRYRMIQGPYRCIPYNFWVPILLPFLCHPGLPRVLIWVVVYHLIICYTVLTV